MVSESDETTRAVAMPLAKATLLNESQVPAFGVQLRSVSFIDGKQMETMLHNAGYCAPNKSIEAYGAVDEIGSDTATNSQHKCEIYLFISYYGELKAPYRSDAKYVYDPVGRQFKKVEMEKTPRKIDWTECGCPPPERNE